MKFLVSCISGSQFKISGEKDKKVQTRTDGDPTDDLPIKVTVEAGDSTCLFLNVHIYERIKETTVIFRGIDFSFCVQ